MKFRLDSNATPYLSSNGSFRIRPLTKAVIIVDILGVSQPSGYFCASEPYFQNTSNSIQTCYDWKSFRKCSHYLSC